MSHSSPHSTPRRPWRFVITALVVVAAQLLAFTVAPLVEARAGRSAVAHVEATGTSLHYAHNDASCAGCAARALAGDVSRQLPPPPQAVPRIASAPQAPARRRIAPCASPSCPRAPPTLA